MWRALRLRRSGTAAPAGTTGAHTKPKARAAPLALRRSARLTLHDERRLGLSLAWIGNPPEAAGPPEYAVATPQEMMWFI